MFYKNDARMLQILLNVYEHLKQDYDYVLVVVGETGVGKSHFVLNLFDTWYKKILRQEITESMVKQVTTDYKTWLKNFKGLKEFDMNVYDEGATTLNAKDHATTISKDIAKLFNVFRAKKFFTVIVLPSFWDLNKYFRERRLRGLVYVDKRGHYRFYTKLGITFLNAYNERRYVKTMWGATPFHNAVFPAYKGVMLKAYEEDKMKTIEGVLDEVINTNAENKKKNASVVDIYKDQVLELLKKGYTQPKIRDELGMSGSGLSRCVNQIRMEGNYPKTFKK